jgi:hypothetical protein
MKRRPRVVLFLGAGFSAGFGHPVMAAFADAVRGHERVDADHERVLGELIKGARQANSFLQSDPKNIEDILSFAEMRDRLDLDNGGSRADHVKRTLGAVYSTYPEEHQLVSGLNSLARLIGYELDPERRATTDSSPEGLSIVTTNYDLNAEYLFRRLGCSVRLGWRGKDSPFHVPPGIALYSQASSDSIPIFRLHGAVNWFAGQNSTQVLIDHQLDVGVGPLSVNIGGAHRARIANFSTKEARVPLIIPPSFLKPELSEGMRSVWAGAAHELSAANFVVFVGYSFPPSDREMAYFLAASLCDNADLSQIFIVDPNAERILETLHAGRFGNHFIGFTKTVPSIWQVAKKLDIPFAWHRRVPATIPRHQG